MCRIHCNAQADLHLTDLHKPCPENEVAKGVSHISVGQCFQRPGWKLEVDPEQRFVSSVALR